MRRVVMVVLVLLGVVWCSNALAVNSVEVVSRTVFVNEVGAEVRIRLVNDITTHAIQLPFEIREVTPGAFPTSVTMSFAERAINPPPDFPIYLRYVDPTGHCNASGGYDGMINDPGPGPHAMVASPEGILMLGLWAAVDPMHPGGDLDGSIMLTFDIGATAGQFEIDTTCSTPDNHLLFVEKATSLHIVPSFTKGTITIRGNAAPVAVCTDVTVSAGSDCQADASIDGGSTDPDGDALTLSQHPPGPYPVGQTTVTLTVSDPFGGTDQCVGIVTVLDTTPPTVVCPSDLTATIGCDGEGAVVVFDHAIAADDCHGVTVACHPPSGSMFAPGLTTVTCAATDAHGNTTQCSFTVTVTTAPVLSGTSCNALPDDVNCDGVANVLDVVMIVNSVFRGGAGQLEPCCFD